jgi:D-inositol-3-phosphate glycosyltransferase
MRKLLWVGDAGCDSGFARATHCTLETLQKTWDVSVLGLNYLGDPHRYPYPIYPAHTGGDAFGVKRFEPLVKGIEPDVVVLQNDPWNIEFYTEQLAKCTKKPLLVGAIAVDGLNCRGESLQTLDACVFWTHFALNEARLGGFAKMGYVIPLGVDLDIYYPTDREEARNQLGLQKVPSGAFVIGYVGRNQPRKRLDLLMMHVAEWIKSRKIPDVYVYLHSAPTGDCAYRLTQLWNYYCPQKDWGPRLIWMQPDVHRGPNQHYMRLTYNCFDVGVTCTQGEGFGLPIIEGMACGIPQIFPNWSALGEWAADAGIAVKCSTFAATVGGPNVIGGIVDREAMFDALDLVYTKPSYRDLLSKKGLSLAEEERYRWSNIGQAWDQTLNEIYEESKCPLALTPHS